MRRFCLYSFVLSLVLFGLIACQEKFENESEYSASNRTEFSVTEDVQTKAGTKSTPITGGTGTFKTGQSTTITAKGGATISGTRKSGTGSIGATYQQGGLAKADINDIHGDWSVTDTIPTYTVNVTATNGGSASGGGTIEYGSSTTISCSQPSTGTWEFNGWTSSNGGSFKDKNSQSTTFTPSADCTVTANFKAATVTPTTGTLVVSVLNWFGSDSYLSKIQYKLDGTTYNKTGRWEEPDEFLNTSLSAGSHTLSVVDAGTTVNGARGYKVYFDPSSFTITAGKTTYVNLIITTNE